MPRKSTAAELQAEEAALNSPLRRSSRIVSGTATTPAGVATRRTSQTLEPQPNTPARATRGRRASAQDSEEKIESQPAKPATRTRRASILAEEELQKETPSTPTKRTRKPSVTTEPPEKEEPEKPKPVRARRGSTASTTDETEEKKPPKTAPVRSRRSSANVEPEVEVTVAPKIPARTTTRRRSSVTDNAVAEEVSTPAKRSTRGRKTSDAEEIGDTAEVKKPAPRGRRSSVNQDEDIKTDELLKPAGRRGRKTSTDDSSVNATPKTPVRMSRRPPITKDIDTEDLTTRKDQISSETQEAPTTISEEEMSPIVLRDTSVRVTPLKKRKILEKVEAELDLSVINESSDDIDNSKHDESSKGKIESAENKSSSELVSSQIISLQEYGEGITPIGKSLSAADETNIELLNVSEALNTSTRSQQETYLNKKRSPTGNDDNPSPRKSPRLTEKLSRSNTPNEELEPKKLPTPKKPRNMIKENEREVSVTERSQTSFLSSGSDGSFKFHLSNVCLINSGQQDSNKENSEDDILNTSKESTGSNKENIEQIESLGNNKADLNYSVKIPVQEPIVVSRVSNVFKPNQKNFSFMEPMEVDEDSACSETVEEKSVKLEKNNLDQKIPESLANVLSADIPTENSLESEESSVEFNYNANKPQKSLDYEALPLGSNPLEETKTVPTLALAKDIIQQTLSEAEGSDSNLLIEETQDTVNFSIQHKTKKTELQPSISSQRRSRSPASNNASLIINQPLEQVKVVLLGKSSSPIIGRRKSKSPVPRAVDGAGTKQDIRRRSKSPCKRSGTKSPSSVVENTLFTENTTKSSHSPQYSDELIVPCRSKSKSKSPSPRRDSIRSPSFLCVDAKQDRVASRKSKSPVCVDEVKSHTSKSPASRESSSNDSIISQSISPKPKRNSTKSPSCLCLHIDDKVKPRKSKGGDRSKSNSPSPRLHETPVARDSKKSRRSVHSKSKSPIPENLDNKNLSAEMSITVESKSPLADCREQPINQVDEETKSRRSTRSKSESHLRHSEDSAIAQDKLTARITRSKSRSPVPSKLLDQSFEKPKGAEEFIVINEKISIEPSQAAKVKDPSIERFPGSVTTNLYTSTEGQFEVSDKNITASEWSNLQDKTEYHTAIATTNNESGFTSVLSTNLEVSQSHIKDSESTHYDFDLDSDDDELFVSKEAKFVTCIDSDTPNEETRELRKKVIVEMKKSFGKTNFTKDKHKNYKSLVDTEGAKEKSQIEVLAEADSGKLSKDCQAEKEENNDICMQKEEEIILTSTKNMALESQQPEAEYYKEEQSKETMVTSTSAKDDDTEDDSRLTTARTRASFNKFSIDDSSDQNCEVDFKEISKDDDKQDIPQEHVECPNQLDNTNKDFPMDEPQIGLSIILDKINKSSEKKKRLPNKDHNEKNLSKISNIDEKEVSANEDILTVDDYPVEKDISKEDNQEYNESNSKDNSTKSKKKNRNKKQKDQRDSKTNDSIEEVTSCKMSAQKVNKIQSDHTNSFDKKPQVKEDSKSVRTKPSLDEFAFSKLEEYLNSKADELESSSGDEEESEAEYNEFIDGMAEEGEEDTPSEDSNQIIDEGESIGSSSDEDLSDDDYDDNDSFICDEEDAELLSGEEYDLDMEKNKKKKKSRIIDLSTLADDDIIKISRKKKEQKEEPKRRSRIITVSDSSDEEQEPTESGFEVKDKSVREGDDNVNKEQSVKGSVILIEESVECVKESEDNANKEQSVKGSVVLIEESIECDNSNAEVNEESQTTDTSKAIVIEESNYENISEAIITIEDSKVVDSSKEVLVDKSGTKDINHSVITEECDSQSTSHNMSVSNLNASLQKRNRKSSLSIQENILIDGVKDPLITQRINTLVESFCATVNQGEISLNLSLEYEGTPPEKAKKQTINVLSDVKICMSQPKVSQAPKGNEEVVIVDTGKPIVLQGEEENKEEVADLEENYEHKESQPSVIESGDLREVFNKKNLKRKLSRHLDDMQEEVRDTKRRKTHTNKDKKTAKPKKSKMEKKLQADVQSTFSSFSIMNQLITDVKSRPRRTMKPTKVDAEVESSWATSKVTNLKPSTSPVTKQEKINMKPKLHPKDFKNQMLSDDKRVKRIDTKTLLKKKGAFF